MATIGLPKSPSVMPVARQSDAGSGGVAAVGGDAGTQGGH